MTKPLLDFTTLAPDHPIIRIDQVDYEMALLGDFGIREQAQLGRLLRQASALEAEVEAAPPVAPTGNPETDAALRVLGPLTETQADQVRGFIDEVVGAIVRAPADVLARLTELQKRQIIVSFMPAVLGLEAPTTTKPSRQSRSTSGRSPRASRRPTAPARTG